MKTTKHFEWLDFGGLRSVLQALALSALLLAGSSRAEPPTTVFVSILPQKYLVESIGSSRVDVQAIVPAGASPELYEPKPAQLARLSEARVYFRIGIPFENGLLPRIRRNHPELEIIDLRDGLKLRALEPAVGSSADDGHGHEGRDPHLWLSPQIVLYLAVSIHDHLVRLDPKGRELYSRNLREFGRKILDVHTDLTAALAPLRGRTLFVFHPAFGYFAEAYGLRQRALETEGKPPSARQLARIIEEARQFDIRILFVQSQFSLKSAQAVADAIGGKVVPLDPLEPDLLKNFRTLAGAILEAHGIEKGTRTK